MLRHHEKLSRYNQLKIDCEGNGWRVHPLCVEVGCRGRCGQSYEWMCKVLGFTKEEEGTEVRVGENSTAL